MQGKALFHQEIFLCTRVVSTVFNSLPEDIFSDWSKLKAFADDKMKLAEKLKPVLGRVENIVGKGENAGYQHFFFSYNVFKNPLFQGR